MTPDQLRAIITRYQKRRNLSSFTRAAESVAIEIGMKPVSIWALVSGVNKIREFVEVALNKLDAER
jgi:hypothetical protein